MSFDLALQLRLAQLHSAIKIRKYPHIVVGWDNTCEVVFAVDSTAAETMAEKYYSMPAPIAFKIIEREDYVQVKKFLTQRRNSGNNAAK